MKISIITVVYNAKDTIAESIESVISQTCFENIEYIIIDGDSKDGTKEILESYNKYFSKYLSEKDNGIYHAMNKGLALASGDIVGFLNSDDFYSAPDVLEKIMNVYESRVDADIVYGDLVYIDQQNKNKVVRKWKSKDYYPKFFEDCNVPPHPSFFFKRTKVLQNIQFNTDYRLAADYDFMFRLMKQFHHISYYLPINIVNMRFGGASNKNLRNRIDQNKEIYLIWKNSNFQIPSFFFLRKIIVRASQFFFK